MKRLTETQQREPNSLERGDFRANGSWNPSAEFSQRGPRYRFVHSLVHARRAARISPAQIAEQIVASDFIAMFPELVQWRAISAWDCWYQASTRTAAEECVKRAGYGTADNAHWEGGAFLPSKDERNLPQIPIDQVRDFVDGLAAAVGSAKDSKRPISDQEFFEGTS